MAGLFPKLPYSWNPRGKGGVAGAMVTLRRECLLLAHLHADRLICIDSVGLESIHLSE